jgi:hypothetical protein
MSEVNNNVPSTEEQQNEGSKIAKQYASNITRLVAIMGGKQNLYGPKKIPQNDVGVLVEDMLKEQRDDLAKEIKTGLKSILEKKIALDKEINAKKEELKKLEESKQKEFNEAVSKLFNKVDGIDKLERDFYATLGGEDAPKGAK